jgi:hypothetical protein
MMRTTAPRALAPCAVLNSLRQAPIVVPDDQSGAASPARASSVCGVAAVSSRVSLVSRVANVNTSVRARAAQYSNCSIARAYGSIDPEMSHSTTSRRGRVRARRRASVTGSPPVRRASRSVRRRSGRSPRRLGAYLRVTRGGMAITSSRISPASRRSSSSVSSPKSRLRRRSAGEA